MRGNQTWQRMFFPRTALHGDFPLPQSEKFADRPETFCGRCHYWPCSDRLLQAIGTAGNSTERNHVDHTQRIWTGDDGIPCPAAGAKKGPPAHVELPELPLFEAHLSRIYSHDDIDHLLIVYNNQTGQEKGELTAKKRNGIGFNKADAPVLSELAEKFLEERFLTEDELQTVSALIAKYHRQWEERELL